MRTIGVVTTSRADYSICKPILRKIEEEPGLELRLIVTGMHLSPRFGMTIREIQADGFAVSERVENPLDSDAPEAISEALGRGVIGMAQLFSRWRPDILLVTGDRFDMIPAPLAALSFKIPVAHVHGGELTTGAFDDAIRHSITKMSHLHFVSMEPYAARLRRMGEEPWRITLSGAPGLDNVLSELLMDRETLEEQIGMKWDKAPLVVTMHPATLAYEDTDRQIDDLLKALDKFDRPLVFTQPNADTRGHLIEERIETFVKNNPGTRYPRNLGTQAYLSLMEHAAAMVGNSSSGIVEAPSFGLPVVNVGSRQEGRIRAANVIDVGVSREEIVEGIQKALDPDFARQLENRKNPYGDGHAADRIVARLKEIELDEGLVLKRFVDSDQNVPASRKRKCVVLGGGGHARVVIESIQAACLAKVVGILDRDQKCRGNMILGVPVLGGDDLLPGLVAEGADCFVVGLGSVGNARTREALFNWGLKCVLEPLTVCHPSAFVSPHSEIGEGSVLMPRSITNIGAQLGRNTIVNSGAIVEHDCVLGDHAHIASGARLASGVHVGNLAHIGLGASVLQGAVVGEGAIVGAGAVVIQNVDPWTVVTGVPARFKSFASGSQIAGSALR